jgi:hypothetical protein
MRTGSSHRARNSSPARLDASCVGTVLMGNERSRRTVKVAAHLQLSGGSITG